MQKPLFVLLFAGAAGTAQAQVRFGVKAGLGSATLAGKDAAVNGTDGKYIRTYQVGGMVNVPLGDLFSVQPELLYTQKGRKATLPAVGADETAKLHYVDLPVLLRLNAHGVFFEAGPQLGYLTGQKTDFSSNGQTATSTSTESFRRLDFGYVAGVGYQFDAGLSLGFRYNGGVSSVDKTGQYSLQNSALQFQAGYFFGGSGK